jgi:hypothetical protein
VALTFVVGDANEIFGADLASAVGTELGRRYPSHPSKDAEPYASDEVDIRGWAALQSRVPQLAPIDAYQAVFIPAPVSGVDELVIPTVADPFHVASLDMLAAALRDFASTAALPADDVELMQLAAHYLEDDELVDQDLDVQTYVQLMLSVKQALARRQPLWLVVCGAAPQTPNKKIGRRRQERLVDRDRGDGAVGG